MTHPSSPSPVPEATPPVSAPVVPASTPPSAAPSAARTGPARTPAPGVAPSAGASTRGGHRPRLIATDLDGTLLRDDKSVSERTVAALAAAEEAGIEVFFVTGRPPRWMDVVSSHVHGHGLAICGNGAAVVDLHRSGHIVELRPLEVADALTVVSALRAAAPGVTFAVEHTDGIHYEPDYPPFFQDPGSLVGPVEELLGVPLPAGAAENDRTDGTPDQPADSARPSAADRDGPGTTASPTALAPDVAHAPEARDARDTRDTRDAPRSIGTGGLPVVKLLAHHPDLDADEFLTLGRTAAGAHAEFTRSSPSALLEVSGRGVSKASTLARCCAARGIAPEEVVAFGDMPNDLEMLRWAGTSYAMANAHPAVSTSTTHRTDSNEADGVAAAVERLLADWH